MPQQTFLFKQRGIQFYISLFSSFFPFFKCISFRPPVHQRCISLPTTSLFTTVQSDDDSWLDAGTKQFFDPAAGGSTHSSPLSEADLTYSPPLPSCSWSPPLSEADLTCSSPVPCSWSPPLSEAGLPHTSPPPAVDRLPFPVGRPRSSTPFWQQICSTCNITVLRHDNPQIFLAAVPGRNHVKPRSDERAHRACQRTREQRQNGK